MMVVMSDPLHRRMTFFCELRAEAFTLMKLRKWHRLRCNQCGAFKICAPSVKTLQRWSSCGRTDVSRTDAPSTRKLRSIPIAAR